MSDRKWFKPAPGMKILDPITREIVPDTGKEVFANDEYFLRRVLDGGGEMTDAPPAPDEE